MFWKQVSIQDEHSRILREYASYDFEHIMGMLERQFTVIHNRAQVMLTLCGIVVTLTGFSGRLIAGTNFAAQILVIIGLSITLIAAAIIVWFVLHVHWLTGQVGDDRASWLMRSLEYRNYKTRYMRIAARLIVLGLTIYSGAVAIMLLNPQPLSLQIR